MSTPPNSKQGTACLGLFLAPFFLVGIGALFFVVVSLLSGELAQALFAGVFATAFLGLPGLVLYGARKSSRAQTEEGALAEQYPGEPWMWKPEWASGRIEASTGTTRVVAWVFAIVWNAISIPGAIAIVPEIQNGEWVALIFLVFPLVGAGLLIWAVRATLRHRKYGVSVFEMAHVPGVIGRGVGGLLRTTVDVRPAGGFVCELSCVHRVTTGSGDNRTTRESIEFQETQTVDAYQPDVDGDGVMVPVAFKLPGSVPETDTKNANNQMLWRLRITADVPGIDFAETFELPVFRTEQSDVAAEPATELKEAPTPFEQPPESRIRVRQRVASVEVLFPAARHPGAAIGVTVAAVVFGGAAAGMFLGNVPILFPIMFGAVAALLFLVTLNLWMGVTEVVAEPGGLEVRWGLLFPYRSRHIPANEIAGIDMVQGMQAGNTVYRDIKVSLVGGRKVAAGSNIRRKREAEWIVSLLREHLGG